MWKSESCLKRNNSVGHIFSNAVIVLYYYNIILIYWLKFTLMMSSFWDLEYLFLCVCVCAHAFLLCMCLVWVQRATSWSLLSLSTFMWVLVIKFRLSNLCYKCFFLLSLLFDHPPILFWGYTLPNFVYIVDKFSLCSPDFPRLQYTTQPGHNSKSHSLNL